MMEFHDCKSCFFFPLLNKNLFFLLPASFYLAQLKNLSPHQGASYLISCYIQTCYTDCPPL